MQVYLKINVLDDQGHNFMGKGGVQLLQGIKRLGSINKAAKEMRLSYIKALKIIRKMEAGLGHKILETTTGGKDHGGAELTPFAGEILDLFMEYDATITAFALERFGKVRERMDALVKKYGNISG
ncbi:MAG: LysR family transcriptional regulator [Desulfomonilia bacterium]|nr:LysR family transcriptional regulator [Desulfomonilia bacterium]HPW69161.1 LysR family transcriptional regulator [Deltaproteobacteria bacterium]